MLKQKEVYLFCAVLGLGSLLGGCAGNTKVAGTEMPNGAPASEKASFKQAAHYVVKPNDCLWKIAGKPNIYGDSFQWPLLFKANRDVIQDPDLIYPKQHLKVAEGLSEAQISHARQLAMDTPPYKPHTKRRETQLAGYF